RFPRLGIVAPQPQILLHQAHKMAAMPHERWQARTKCVRPADLLGPGPAFSLRCRTQQLQRKSAGARGADSLARGRPPRAGAANFRPADLAGKEAGTPRTDLTALTIPLCFVQ